MYEELETSFENHWASNMELEIIVMGYPWCSSSYFYLQKKKEKATVFSLIPRKFQDGPLIVRIIHEKQKKLSREFYSNCTFWTIVAKVA